MPPEQRNEASAAPVAVAEPSATPAPSSAPAVPLAFQPYLDPRDARYGIYPRPPLVRGARWVLCRPYVILVAYPLVVFQNVLTLIANGGPVDIHDLAQALLLGQAVVLLQGQPLVALPVVVLIGLAVLVGRATHRDWAFERKVLALREEEARHRGRLAEQLPPALATQLPSALDEHLPAALDRMGAGGSSEQALTSGGGQRHHTADIFVSSTSRDLGQDYRPAVRRAIKTLRQHPRMMEDFGAHAGDATSVSTAEVAAADLVLLIVAWRYGYVPAGETRSVTHLEYREARALGKPVLVFLAAPETEARDAPFPHDQRDSEHAEQLKAFRAELERSHVADYFTTPDELERAVIKALHTWISQRSVGREQVGGALEGAAPAVPAGPPFEEGALPAATEFIGRAEDLAWVMARLTTPREGGERIGAISAIGGLGGIGKTALAAEAIRRLRAQGHFQDGVVVVIAAGQTDARALLREALSHFDPRVPAEATLSQLASAARSMLDGKDALIVFDNVEPELDARAVIGPLAATGVALLLTARHEIPTLPAGATHQLDVLPHNEARDLFAVSWRDVRAEVLSAEERATVGRIVEELGRHTLAVKLAGAYARRRELAAVARELANPQRALDLAVPGVTEGVRRAFETSYLALDEESQRLFAGLGALTDDGRQAVEAKVLGAFAGTNYGRRAALALAAGLGLERPEAAVDTLVFRALADATTDETLPEKADRERLRLHPLARAYADGLFAQLPKAERDAAAWALAARFADYVREVGFRAVHAFALDEESIVGALEWAHAHRHDALVVRLCSGMDQFWRDTGRTRASLRYLPWGVAAAEAQLGAQPDAAGDATALAAWRERADTLFWLLNHSASAFRNTGQLNEAEQRYQRCLTLARQVGNRRNEGVALTGLGLLAEDRGRLEEAEGYLQQALVIDREVRNRDDEGVDLATLGRLALERRRLEEAEDYLRQSLEIRREVQDRRGEGIVLTALGQIAALRSRMEEAEGYVRQALVIDREVQDRRGEGVDLATLGQLAQARGRLDEAEDHYQQGLAILREVQDALDVAAVSEAFGAFLITRRGKREEGCAMLAEAATLYEGMGLEERAEEARERARRLGCG